MSIIPKNNKQKLNKQEKVELASELEIFLDKDGGSDALNIIIQQLDPYDVVSLCSISPKFKAWCDKNVMVETSMLLFNIVPVNGFTLKQYPFVVSTEDGQYIDAVFAKVNKKYEDFYFLGSDGLVFVRFKKRNNDRKDVQFQTTLYDNEDDPIVGISSNPRRPKKYRRGRHPRYDKRRNCIDVACWTRSGKLYLFDYVFNQNLYLESDLYLLNDKIALEPLTKKTNENKRYVQVNPSYIENEHVVWAKMCYSYLIVLTKEGNIFCSDVYNSSLSNRFDGKNQVEGKIIGITTASTITNSKGFLELFFAFWTDTGNLYKCSASNQRHLAKGPKTFFSDPFKITLPDDDNVVKSATIDLIDSKEIHCVITEKGSLYTFGDNVKNSLGFNEMDHTVVKDPIRINDTALNGKKALSASTVGYFTCVLTADHKVHYFGGFHLRENLFMNPPSKEMELNKNEFAISTHSAFWGCTVFYREVTFRNPVPVENFICDNCNNIALFDCGGCDNKSYCSQECANIDWKLRHGKSCNNL